MNTNPVHRALDRAGAAVQSRAAFGLALAPSLACALASLTVMLATLLTSGGLAAAADKLASPVFLALCGAIFYAAMCRLSSINRHTTRLGVRVAVALFAAAPAALVLGWAVGDLQASWWLNFSLLATVAKVAVVAQLWRGGVPRQYRVDRPATGSGGSAA